MDGNDSGAPVQNRALFMEVVRCGAHGAKRGGDSPDVADALALTYAAQIAYETDDSPQSYIHDFNPLDFKG